MSAVEIASTGWGTLLRPTGPAGSLVPVVGATCQVNILGGGSATIWSDNTRTVSLTQPLTTRSDGTLPGFIDLGTYTGTWTIPGSAPFSHQLDMAGPTGANGPPGVGASWQGVWSSGTTYTLNQGVSRNGLPYISNANGNLNHDPATDAVNWTAINPVDGLATAGTMRTLGTGAQQAMAGNDIRVASLSINVKAAPYNAKGDGVTDDTTAIQAALAAIPTATGGTLVFPAGKYIVSGQLVCDGYTNLQLSGGGGGASLDSYAQLMFTSTATPCISSNAANGLGIDGLHIENNNAGFTGTILAGGGLAASGPITITKSYIGGSGAVNGAAQAVSLSNVVNVAIRDCTIFNAGYGIARIAGGYANTVTIDNCLFNKLRTGTIHNAGQAWLVKSCSFEPTTTGAANAYDETAGQQPLAFTFIGCWFGDATSGTAAWITTSALGLTVVGNYMLNVTGAPCLSPTGAAITVAGNYFAQGSAAVALPVAGVNGFSFTGNNVSTTAPFTNLANSVNTFVVGNLGVTTQSIGSGLQLATVGFNGTAPIAKPTVTGSKGANAALASLMTALSGYGLVVDSTT